MMAKRKAINAAKAEAAGDDIFNAMMFNVSAKMGTKKVMTQMETERRICGIPLPSIALAYALGNDVLPFNRVLLVNGLQASGKSSFLTDVSRWFALCGGASLNIQNEGKDYPDIRAGIYQFNEALMGRIGVAETTQCQEWQKAVTEASASLRKALEKWPSDRSLLPLFAYVDSFTGTDTMKELEKISDTGSAQRGYSEIALLITKYMQSVPDLVVDLPLILAGVQHLKLSTDKQGLPVRTTPGGAAPKFYETFEIEFSRGKVIDNAHDGGVNTKLTTRKNSMGDYPRTIDVIYRWYDEIDQATGRNRRYFIWDWYDATIQLYTAIERKSKTKHKELMDVCDVRPVSGRRAWSHTLSIPKDSPVSYTKLGEILEHQYPHLHKDIYNVLGVQMRRRFQGQTSMQDIYDSEIGDIPVTLPKMGNIKEASEDTVQAIDSDIEEHFGEEVM
jgi:hypothetical protein